MIKQKIILDLFPEEVSWIDRLCQAAGLRYRIELIRQALDEYARQIGFDPRPQNSKKI